MRGMRFRLRQRDDQAVGDDLAKPPRATGADRLVGGGHASSRRRASSIVGWRLGGVPGQRQEHVVERRPAQADVVDRDPGLVEVADDLDERLRAARRRARSACGCARRA